MPATRFGDLSIDYLAQTVHLRGQQIHLTATQYKILAFLSIHAGQVVTRENLRRHTWGDGSLFQDKNNLAVHIHHIREALQDSSQLPVYIETCRGAGYRFAPQPEPETAANTWRTPRDTAFDRIDRQTQDTGAVAALLDGHGTIDWISTSVASVTGWTPHAIIGLPIQIVIHEEDIQHVIAATKLMPTPPTQTPIRWLTPQGTSRALRLQRKILPDASGIAIGALDHWIPM